MRFTQNNLIVPLTSGMVSITADKELDSFHMRGYDHATILLHFNSALEGLTDSPVFTLETASSDSGDSADLTFHYRWNSASTITTSADVLGSWSSASTLTVTSGYAGYMLIMEFDAEDLPAASKTYEWVTVDIDVGTTSAGSVAGYAILSNPRYAKNVMPAANV